MSSSLSKFDPAFKEMVFDNAKMRGEHPSTRAEREKIRADYRPNGARSYWPPLGRGEAEPADDWLAEAELSKRFPE